MNEAEPNSQTRSPRSVTLLALALLIPLLAFALQGLFKETIQRMGGRVWAESSPGEGATFYLEIPT